MNRNLVFLSSILILICSCNEKQPKFKEINIRKVTTTENLKFNSVRLLRLKPNSFAPISGIDKLIVAKERIVVLDKLRGNSLFMTLEETTSTISTGWGKVPGNIEM